MTCKHQEVRKRLKASEVVLGLTEAKVQELVDKHNCIINRTDLVPVVTVEWLRKYCKTNSSFETKTLGCSEYMISRVTTSELLEAVRLQAKVMK